MSEFDMDGLSENEGVAVVISRIDYGLMLVAMADDRYEHPGARGLFSFIGGPVNRGEMREQAIRRIILETTSDPDTAALITKDMRRLQHKRFELPRFHSPGKTYYCTVFIRTLKPDDWDNLIAEIMNQGLQKGKPQIKSPNLLRKLQEQNKILGNVGLVIPEIINAA